ncbi:MAG: hypothetical protein KC425_25375 [Anaerolineales bacterium]|nr:hypothetical protein [Anaerolineales bacterium]
MAANANSAEIQDLQSRLEWLDGERRKVNRKLAELEQRFELQQRDLQGREQRIQELEQKLSTATAQLSRMGQVDAKLTQFKDEMVELIEQYDQRRIRAEEELDRLRRVEHENTAREIADIRKELPAIPRLQQDMALRQAEEGRLANLIGQQKNKIGFNENQIEEVARTLTFLEEKEKQNGRNIAELQTAQLEVNKRWGPIQERLDALYGNINRLETMIQPLMSVRDDLNQRMESWMEQIRLGEHDRNKQLESWRYLLEEHTDSLARFSKEWITFADQYKEAKMAIQTLAEWQTQIEKQQRESAELMRIETHRMQSRWDNFQQEIARRLKTSEVEGEQRWHGVDRINRQVQEQFTAVEALLEELQQDKDLMWRIQSAQADAMKKIPLVWLEEIEKARKQDPNRRRQPALVPVREE